MRKLPSGRIQASYIGPDQRRHSARQTFEDSDAATIWLKGTRRTIDEGTWKPRGVAAKPVTLREYSETWLALRHASGKHKPTTRQHYRDLLDRHILPKLGDERLEYISLADVDAWYSTLDESKPTMRAHAYGLLKTIMGHAVKRGDLAKNPCQIDGGDTVRRASKTRPATLDELITLTDAMPARFELMILLASWCALRYGELTELRRRDIDLKAGAIRVDRAVTRIGGGFVIGTPKSDAGTRDVAIPPHIMDLVKDHLRDHTDRGRDALLFPNSTGTHLAPSAFYRSYYPAREAAGRPDLRFHDLRHTGAVLAALSGATLAELKSRLGHSTSAAAMRYQHAAEGRDRVIADALSALATAGR